MRIKLQILAELRDWTFGPDGNLAVRQGLKDADLDKRPSRGMGGGSGFRDSS